jgi:hypothetical protein
MLRTAAEYVEAEEKLRGNRPAAVRARMNTGTAELQAASEVALLAAVFLWFVTGQIFRPLQCNSSGKLYLIGRRFSFGYISCFGDLVQQRGCLLGSEKRHPANRV